MKDLLRSVWSPIGWVGIADLWGVRLTRGRWPTTNSVVIVTMCADADTHARMPWVLGGACGTVVRGLCQRPIFGYGLRVTGYEFWFRFRSCFCFRLCFDFGFGLGLGLSLGFGHVLYFGVVDRCSRSFVVHCTFLLVTSSALDMRELCCWKGD